MILKQQCWEYPNDETTNMTEVGDALWLSYDRCAKGDEENHEEENLQSWGSHVSPVFNDVYGIQWEQAKYKTRKSDHHSTVCFCNGAQQVSTNGGEYENQEHSEDTVAPLDLTPHQQQQCNIREKVDEVLMNEGSSNPLIRPVSEVWVKSSSKSA